MILSIFSCFPSVCLLWKNAYSDLYPFHNLVICICYIGIWFLKFFCIKLFSDIPFANIFSHLVGCLFILLMVSFTVKKLLSLISSIFCFCFCFCFPCLRWQIQKYCKDLCQRVQSLFSCKNFMLSGLTFRSLIHFEFIFVCGMRKCSNFIL